MKTSKGLDAVGSKKVLLDQSMFGKEEDLPENLWHEAWHNQDSIFNSVCEPAIYSYFKTHWTFCSSQEQFSENYPAILSFDSYIRRTYVHTRVRLTGAEYSSKYAECKMEAMLGKMNRALRVPASPAKVSPRYEPYPGRHSDRPFPRGTRGGASSLCLICAREGIWGQPAPTRPQRRVPGSPLSGLTVGCSSPHRGPWSASPTICEIVTHGTTAVWPPLMCAPSVGLESIMPPPENAFEVMDRVVTPFVDGYSKFNLSNSFPTLIHRLRHGFPIGRFLPLDRTYAFKNHVMDPLHVEYVHNYLLEEVALGRMSGPYSADELRQALSRPAFSDCPLGCC
jgi:hypothetical protein